MHAWCSLSQPGLNKYANFTLPSFDKNGLLPLLRPLLSTKARFQRENHAKRAYQQQMYTSDSEESESVDPESVGVDDEEFGGAGGQETMQQALGALGKEHDTTQKQDGWMDALMCMGEDNQSKHKKAETTASLIRPQSKGFVSRRVTLYDKFASPETDNVSQSGYNKPTISSMSKKSKIISPTKSPSKHKPQRPQTAGSWTKPEKAEMTEEEKAREQRYKKLKKEKKERDERLSRNRKKILDLERSIATPKK